jgi:HK97 family phage major capsid protein
LNKAEQLERRGRELHDFAGRLGLRLKATKTQTERNALEPELKRLEAAFDDLDHEKRQLVAAEAFNARVGHNYGNSKGHDSLGENKAVGRQPSVLDIPEPEYKSLFDAVQRRQPSHRINSSDIGTKAPFGEGSFTSGGLPPILMPQLTQQLPYEPDEIFDHLIQTAAPAASSVEWLSHTGNTNPAAATAELSQKPDLGMALTTHTQPFVKIAALASFSTESLADFGYFMQFVPGEMYRAARDARTNEVLNGSGSSPHMLGLLNTSGVLTRSIGSDTPLDSLRKSFNDIRVGSAFGNASLVVLNPTTWADLQLQKSTTGLYLLNPTDPNAIGSLNDIFGVKTVSNTYCPAGTAIVLDTSKAVLAWTRQSWSLEINQYGTNEFGENYVTFRVEGRYAIGVMYPTAINLVTGLPSS